MKVLSLFDGMSCGQLALQKAGIHIDKYYAAEIDKFAMKIAQKNFTNTIQLGDVININNYGYNIFEKVSIDLLIGGSPCQGFSFAGKQLNFDDPRSKLFFEFSRIYNELKPKYFLLENVCMIQKSEDIISEYLNVKPILINSSLVSAQNRRRLYWTNIPNITPPTIKNILYKDIKETNVDKRFYYSEKMLAWIDRHSKRKNKKLRIQQDNDKVQMIEATHYKGCSSQRFFAIEDTLGLRYITPLECERAQTITDNYTESVSNTQRYKMIGNGWTINILSHIFSHMNY